MIVAVLLLALGKITFVAQDLPYLNFGYTGPIGGGYDYVGFRHADLDGDGANDLILPRQVLLQRQGRFDTGTPIPLPEYDQAVCDIWGRELYMRTGRQLEVLRLVSTPSTSSMSSTPSTASTSSAASPIRWERSLSQTIKWPDPQDRDITRFSSLPDADSGFRFASFLHDMNGDGMPELVAPAEDGLHIFSKTGETYRETALLDIFPPLRYVQPLRQELWPENVRGIAFPPREMACDFVLRGAHITIIRKEYAGKDRCRYDITRHVLDPDRGYAILPDQTARSVSAVLPDYMTPCLLNQAGEIDYAGVDMDFTTPLRPMVCITSASTDGGSRLQTFRAQSFRPRCSFIDMDADGDLDMITEGTDLFRGGVRESVSRFLTSRTLLVEVSVRLQDAHGLFPAQPDYTAKFTIKLTKPPVSGDRMLQLLRYQGIIEITGDFDGNGRRDLLVRDAPDRLAVYLHNGAGFPAQPDATIPVGPEQFSRVYDVDGDGRSDVVMFWSEGEGPNAARKCRVLWNREANE